MAGSLYRWQEECLATPGVLAGRNLVYCAPTSGGKSLVAEVLMLRRIAATNRPAMLVLPFVALCAEKSASLSRLLAPLGKEVREFYGGNHSHAAVGMVRGRGCWLLPCNPQCISSTAPVPGLFLRDSLRDGVWTY